MGVGSQWHTKGSGKTKIGQLQVTVAVNEKVLWLQVAVKDTVCVAVPDALAQLAHELLDHIISKSKTSEVWPGPFWKGLSAATI